MKIKQKTEYNLPQTGIVLDWYEGSYGPTIRIDTITPEDLLRLRQIFRDLSVSTMHIINLVLIDGITTVALDELVLANVRSQHANAKSLKRKKNKFGKNCFEWSLVPDGWRSCLERVDVLLERNSAGHQYLNEEQEGKDDAIVELSYKESIEFRAKHAKGKISS